MLKDLLQSVICQTFEDQCGRWQVKKPQPSAFFMSFGIRLDYDKEEGYRNLDVIIYAPYNYVQIWTRRRWEVLPLEYLTDDGDVKPGKDYVTGAEEWTKIADHDSGWRSAVGDLLRNYEDELLTFSSHPMDVTLLKHEGIIRWFTLIDSSVIDLDLAQQLKDERGV